MKIKVIGSIAKLINEEKGSYMVEMALVLVGVALTVFVAASSLSTDGIVPKYESIKNEVLSVPVPDLTP
ncbi:MAG: hypothetical protein HGA27_08555 [Peptococcaceae bacterium]|nr:hypothetical protein [Peptococcaceae bacterium]